MVEKLKIPNRCINYGRNIVQTGTQLCFDKKNMHSFGDAEQMSLTLFLNTIASPTRVNLGFIR